VAGQRVRHILWWVVTIGLVVVALDQLSKWQVVRSLSAQVADVVEVTGFFNLVLVCNTGISFGLLPGDSAVKAWLLRLGNVVDRVRIGCVIDFIDVHAAGWHWPAFNLADSAITVGVALLLVHGLFFDAPEGK
jgi:signal peptidase II